MPVNNTFVYLPTQVAGLLGVNHGGTDADLSATGGPSQVLKQTTVGGPIIVAQLAFSDISGTLINSQLPASGVTPGTYTNATITVNAQGVITVASSGTGGFSNPMTTLGDMIYEASPGSPPTPTPARLVGNITAVKQFLTQTGTGLVSAAPVWGVIAASDLPSGVALKPSSSDNIQYVSTQGNDSSDGLSEGSAKLTIQAAVNVIQATASERGVVLILPGVYSISSTISITGNVSLVGIGGPNATFILNQSTTDDAVDFSLGSLPSLIGGVTFEGITITQSILGNNAANGSTGIGLSITGAGNGVTLKNFEIRCHSTLLKLFDCFNVQVSNFWLLYCGTAGILIDNTSDTSGGGWHIDDGEISNYGATGTISSSIGINWKRGGGLYVNPTVDMTSFNQGLVINPVSGANCNYGFFCDLICDSSINDNIVLDGSAGNITSMHFVNCWGAFSTNGNGMTIKGANVDSVFFAHGRLRQNGLAGASLQGGSNVTIANCEITGNSTQTSNAHDGVEVSAGVSDWGVDSCFIGNFANGGVSTQRYGISVAAGSSNRYSYANCDLNGNVTGAVNDLGTGTQIQIYGNLPAPLTGTSRGVLQLESLIMLGTGGAHEVLMQTTSGGAITVAQLAASDLSNGTTGSGSVVLATSPTLSGLLTVNGTASHVADFNYATSPYITVTGGSVQGYMQANTTGSVVSMGALSNNDAIIVANDAEIVRAYAAGGIGVGSPTGGSQGAGTVNAQNGYYVAGSQIAASNLSNGTTGTGAIVLASSPTLLGTPVVGLSSYTSAITDSPALTIAGSYEPSSGVFAEDSWTIQDHLQSATINGNSNLIFSHSGTPGNLLFVISPFAGSATPSTIQNSPSLTIRGSYESAASPLTYAIDQWTIQDVIGAGLNGTSALTFSHTGTSGAATISVPTLNATAYQVSGSPLAAANLADGTTGSGVIVLATSPALAGSPTAPTPTAFDNSTKLATTSYVDAQTYSGGTFEFADDFTCCIAIPSLSVGTTLQTDTNWNSNVVSGGTGSIASTNGTFTNPGQILVTTPATSGDGIVFFRSTGTGTAGAFGALGSNANWELDFWVKLGQTTSCTVRWGFCTGSGSQAATSPPTDGIWVRYDTSASDTKFTWETRSGSTSSTSTTNSVNADTNFHHFRIRSTVAGTIGFTVDNGTEFTTTTDVPTVALAMFFQTITQTTSAATATYDRVSYLAKTGRT